MYYWQIVNYDTGEILESSKRYKTIRGAHLGAKAHVIGELSRFQDLNNTTIDITIFDSKDKAVATTYKFIASYASKTEMHIQGVS